MRVWKHGTVRADDWRRLDEAEWPPSGAVLVPAGRLDEALSVAAPDDRPGVLLGGDDDPAVLVSVFQRLALIAIDFPSAVDGRGYSLARAVRQLGYTGELRAVGHVRSDQAFYLRRCGFDAFEIEVGVDAEDFSRGFGDFSGVYQHAADDRVPIARRRGRG